MVALRDAHPGFVVSEPGVEPHRADGLDSSGKCWFCFHEVRKTLWLGQGEASATLTSCGLPQVAAHPARWMDDGAQRAQVSLGLGGIVVPGHSGWRSGVQTRTAAGPLEQEAEKVKATPLGTGLQ